VSKQHIKEERQRYLELLQRECERQNSIVNGLLEVVKLNTTLEQKTTNIVYLEDVVPTIVSTYQPLAQEKGIQLGYTIPSGFPPVNCAAASLQQIIVNLLNNSLNFTPSGGQVSVQALLKQEHIEIFVSDTGIGILPQDLAKVFNPFYRGRNINNNTNLGAGLGLTLVKQLVENCGGSITISSKINKGTIVKLLLPIVKEIG
jgi:signal transduction histidine kinase